MRNPSKELYIGSPDHEETLSRELLGLTASALMLRIKLLRHPSQEYPKVIPVSEKMAEMIRMAILNTSADFHMKTNLGDRANKALVELYAENFLEKS